MLRNKAVVVSTALLVAAGTALVSFNLAQAKNHNSSANDRPSTTPEPVVNPRLATGDRFAVINDDGTLARGFGVSSSQRLATGEYEVIFNRNVTKCAYVATIGLAARVGAAPPGEITVVGRAGTKNGVFVQTLNSSGAVADRPFHLIVGCKP